ncbi:protease inhibitor I42 family protein [Nocardia sp. NPDC050710]|uniref:protease inhibitor I42 family protein n=1 Tax=Nocardia sp. NPDC050710 TaxID=3157220 RepID=UPI0033EBB807
MRKSLVVLALLGLGLGVAACGSDGESDHVGHSTSGAPTTTPAADGAVRVTESDSGRERRLATGQRLIVTLPSNPSTGYSWRLGVLDQGVLRQEGEPDYRTNSDRPVLPGAGGSETWVFTGNAAGVGRLVLEYVRPWEHGVEPAQKFALTVEVK